LGWHTARFGARQHRSLSEEQSWSPQAICFATRDGTIEVAPSPPPFAPSPPSLSAQVYSPEEVPSTGRWRRNRSTAHATATTQTAVAARSRCDRGSG
jgi:hypothetical protein